MKASPTWPNSPIHGSRCEYGESRRTVQSQPRKSEEDRLACTTRANINGSSAHASTHGIASYPWGTASCAATAQAGTCARCLLLLLPFYLRPVAKSVFREGWPSGQLWVGSESWSYSSSKHLIIAEGEMRKGKPLGVAPYRVIWNVPVDRLRSATFKLRL